MIDPPIAVVLPPQENVPAMLSLNPMPMLEPV